DSLVGLLHILPRLGKSGGHIPHSSPFSYSLRLSPPFFFSFFFFFIFVLKPRSFVGAGGNAWDPRRGTFGEAECEWATGTHRRLLELRRASVGYPCSLEYKAQHPPFTANCALRPATWIWRGSLTQIPVVKETRVESGQFLLLSVLCMLFILVALAVSATFFCVRQRSHLHMKEKLASLGTDTSTDATATYQ
ncbi:hypothetical protein INR49_014899, partial [Caranx melampygus]